MEKIRTMRKSTSKIIRAVLGKILIYGIISVPLIAIFGALAGLVAQAFSKKVISGIIPSGLTLDHWRFLYSAIVYGTKVFPNTWLIVANTLYLALGTAGLVVLLGSLSGYALSRVPFRGREGLMLFILVLHAFPAVIILIAMFIVLNEIGLYGKGLLSLTGIMIIKGGLEIPMASWVLKGFFDNIPWDIEMSALIDGCTRLKLWRKVIFPLVLPGVAAIATLSFIAGWGEFVLVYTYITGAQYYTFPVFLKELTGDFIYVDWGLLSAVGLFYAVPPIIFFLLTQEALMKVHVGGLKGGA